MGNSEYDELLRDYIGRITGQSGEATLIKSVPWLLGTPGTVPELIKGLQLEASRFCELPHQLKFSLIAPLTHQPHRFLNELILSARCQSWFHWELILADDGREQRENLALAKQWAERDPRIKLLTTDRPRGLVASKNAAFEAASGDFVCILDDHAILHPCSLGIFARNLNSSSDLNFLFSHEARVNELTTRIRKYIRKPEFDLFTLLRKNYIGSLTAIRTDLLMAVRNDGNVFRPGYDGVEDHDLMVRLALSGKVQSMCFPFFLYYSRNVKGRTNVLEEADFHRKTLNLIEEYLPAIYPGARWTLIPPSPPKGNQYPGIHLRSLPGHPSPSLLVIMPFKDQPEMTVRCLDSIEQQEHELDVEVVMVNQRSQDPQTKRVLRAWMERPRRYRYHILDHDGAFNYARMNNGVYEKFGRDKDLLLLLNNDTEIFSVDCFQTMAMQVLADEKCGIVGMRLLFPEDGSVQHGGFKIWDNLLAVCGCHVIDHSRTSEEYVNDERIAYGVTFAVAMMRRTTFERLGTLEEILYPNAYGDVALCARAMEAGMRNYYFGTLVGLHYEVKTRGKCIEDVEAVAFHERYGHHVSHWRMRHLSYTEVPESSSVAPPPFSGATPYGLPPALLPLRYRLADRINNSIRFVLGPTHWALRSGLHQSGQLLKKTRSRILQLRPIDRRAWMKRLQKVDPALRGHHLDGGASANPDRGNRSGRFVGADDSSE